jgi:hypothetical protein
MGKWSQYRHRGGKTPGAGTAPAPPEPPLDIIGTAAWAAYSLTRRLRSAYAGNAFTVRRLSDNATLAIGFDGDGEVDVAALTAFVGASTGRVILLNDQSGNGRDMGGTFATPPDVIVSGVLVTDTGGHPAMTNTAAGQDLFHQSDNTGQPLTALAVLVLPSSLTPDGVLICQDATTRGAVRTSATHIQLNSGATLTGGPVSAGSRYVVTYKVLSGDDSIELGQSGATTGSAGTNAPFNPRFGHPINGQAGTRLAEWLIFAADLSSGDIADLQDDLLAFYD